METNDLFCWLSSSFHGTGGGFFAPAVNTISTNAPPAFPVDDHFGDFSAPLAEASPIHPIKPTTQLDTSAHFGGGDLFGDFMAVQQPSAASNAFEPPPLSFEAPLAAQDDTFDFSFAAPITPVSVSSPSPAKSSAGGWGGRSGKHFFVLLNWLIPGAF